MSMASYGIRILPGAGLATVAREEGVIDDATDLLKPTFYMAEPLRQDREWLDQQVKRMSRPGLRALPQWAGLFWRTWRAGRQKLVRPGTALVIG